MIPSHPDRERQSGPCGYADIELPSGITVYCPVFTRGQLKRLSSGHSQAISSGRTICIRLYMVMIYDDIIAQIREVDPGAFEQERCLARTAKKRPGLLDKGVSGESPPAGDSR